MAQAGKNTSLTVLTARPSRASSTGALAGTARAEVGDPHQHRIPESGAGARLLDQVAHHPVGVLDRVLATIARGDPD